MPSQPVSADRNEERVADSAKPNGSSRRGGKLAEAARSGRQDGGGRGRRPGSSRPSSRSASSPARSKAKSARGAGASSASRKRLLNYPRAGKGPIHRWLPSWRFVLGAFLLMIAAMATTFIIAYNIIKIPAPSEFAQAQSTTVYYADGQTKMGTFAEVNRTIIDASTLPDYVGNAVIASEDRSFYTNNGVDPKGIARAFWNNLRGGATQGASTLTQQYIKNYYVDTTSSYVGKFKQAIMAIKIDREMSKQDILDSYLNTVYFGRGAYGIEAAAQAFFGHSASELTASESALLAGIMPAPSAWDPAVDPEQAQVRFQRVLDFMLADGYITQSEYDSAAMPETTTQQTDEVYAGPGGYILQLVRSELVAKAGMTTEQIDTGGYRITTTINKTDQDAAVAAVQALPEGHSENLRAALVSIDATNGGILALYGGADYLTSQVSSATDAVAQAGSTFKPFALVGALEKGATLSNGYSGSSPMSIEGTTFQNYGNTSYGWSNLITATAYSINTPYVQLNRDLGPEVTSDVAVRAGYPKDTMGLDTTVQNVLGSASPHTIDIATAYATFAAQGTRHETHVVAQVANAGGDVAYTANTTGEKVFSDDVMADATYAMQQVVSEGSGKTARSLGRPIAAKTGSSSENKSAQFVGFTPQIATAVTLYQTGADGSEESITPWGSYDEITGSTYPADIFTQYMTTALADLPVAEFAQRTSGSYKRGSLYGTVAPQEEYELEEEYVEPEQDEEQQSEEKEDTSQDSDPTQQDPAPAATQEPAPGPTQGSGGEGSGQGGVGSPQGNG
ncbi:transglycosylase domain-containing protein [Actinomyces urogenitalis]|nr:transglycosylase domain-containing protein [Actinomyces urogenitalis]MDK8835295.1 transglycosylase domain-containing protein [Actinomyces urogenitalis]